MSIVQVSGFSVHDLKGNPNMTLSHYNEHPDQALMILTLDAAIERLREYMKAYLEQRNIGAGKTANLMHPIVRRWAHPVYQGYVSKTFNEDNLRDFIRTKRASNLIEPARLLVHSFIWISELDYRRDWGPFDPIEGIGSYNGNGSPGATQIAPASTQNLSG